MRSSFVHSEEAVRPYSAIEVDAIQVVIPVEAHPQKDLCGFVVGVDCPCAPASWDALEKEETAVRFDQAFGPGFARFERTRLELPTSKKTA